MGTGQLAAAHTLPREGCPPGLSWQAAVVGAVAETKGSIARFQRQPQLQSQLQTMGPSPCGSPYLDTRPHASMASSHSLHQWLFGLSPP